MKILTESEAEDIIVEQAIEDERLESKPFCLVCGNRSPEDMCSDCEDSEAGFNIKMKEMKQEFD